MPRRTVSRQAPVDASAPQPCTDIVMLLARCLAAPDDAAWIQLADFIKPLALKFCRLVSAEQRQEFAGWLLGWPRLFSTLGCAYKRLREFITTNPDASEADRQKYFANYFARIIRSAGADFLKEVARHHKNEIPASHEQDTSTEQALQKDDAHEALTFSKQHQDRAEIPAGDLISQLANYVPAPCNDDDDPRIERALAALDMLKPELRVPFLLTCALEQLQPRDYEWIAKQSGRTLEDVEVVIEKERAANSHLKYPLSSAFIANLLGLTQDNVSQRVRRARLALANAIKRVAND